VKKDFYNLEKEENFDLKAELKSIGMTQKDFAKFTDFHINSIGKWARKELPTPKWVTLLINCQKKNKAFEELSKTH
jgi:transcriptional regulator with XRE-family HTH domain